MSFTNSYEWSRHITKITGLITSLAVLFVSSNSLYFRFRSNNKTFNVVGAEAISPIIDENITSLPDSNLVSNDNVTLSSRDNYRKKVVLLAGPHKTGKFLCRQGVYLLPFTFLDLTLLVTSPSVS